MKVKISKIKPHAGASMHADESGCINIDDYTADIRVCGGITNKDAVYEFKGGIKGVVHTYCAKCLKDVDYPYETEIVWHFIDEGQNSPGEAFEEVCVFTGEVIDFEPFAAGVIRADMPIAIVCGGDCKGLCDVCGCNLNERSCDCVKEKINPVFDGLRLAFNDEKM